MRMFLSVSGHSSELSIANHSPRSTVSQLKCVSDTISSWFENHQPQRTKISPVIYAPFIQNSNQMASRLTVTTSFLSIFSTLVIFKATSKLFGSQGCSDDKKWLDFSSIFIKICRFRSSIPGFRCKFSFNEERRSSQVWQWRDFSRPITIFATHSNQWNFFILNQS